MPFYNYPIFFPSYTKLLCLYSFLSFISITYLFIVGKHITCKAQGQGEKFGSEDGLVKNCVFPFTYNGKKYTGCSKDGKGKWWCATKVDSKGIMKKDKWARCNEYCPTDDGML